MANVKRDADGTAIIRIIRRMIQTSARGVGWLRLAFSAMKRAEYTLFSEVCCLRSEV